MIRAEGRAGVRIRQSRKAGYHLGKCKLSAMLEITVLRKKETGTAAGRGEELGHCP